jgi:predicted TIM-barrel fold metal-dependent hydrolase
MSEFLSADELRHLRRAMQVEPAPIPLQMISNGEFFPARQSEAQRAVAACLKSEADKWAPRHGLDRRTFLLSAAGMAGAFMAMNKVHGAIFEVAEAEASTPHVADARAKSLSGQWIVDLHTHYIHDNPGPGLQGFAQLRERARIKGWNPALGSRVQTLDDLHLNNYVKEMWLDSDTKIAALSGAPSDIPADWLLANSEIANARARVNAFAGSRRLLSHFIFTPGQPGWLEAIDRGIEELKPDAWKGYTIGDNTHKDTTRYPWRMDDERVAYKGYAKFERAGIHNVAVHKGLFTVSDQQRFPRLIEYARVDDVGKAAKDWPKLNFLIYHAAYRYTGDGEPKIALDEFKKTGRMEWVSDLADIPSKFGVSNVYADIGAVFAACCIAQPRTAAAMLGILIKGMGADHVIWGTDSIWFGSPQWQIEAFRRLEIPEDMQRRFAFTPLGAADGPVKRAIFGANGARLHNVGPSQASLNDSLSEQQALYAEAGMLRSNRAYGWVRR